MAALHSSAGCQPDCDPLDALFADGFARPDPPPDDVDLVWSGGEGGLSVRSDVTDREVFEPLFQHLIGGTSTTPGMARWSLTLGLDRVLVVEHRLPVARDDVIPVEILLEDLVFTGGRGTSTWWDLGWGWTEGSTTAARAVFTEAFERTLTSTAVSGQIEVRQVEPVELRVGLTFSRNDGATELYWNDVFFDVERGFDPCD